MLRVIGAEFKKVFKSKVNIILLVLFFGFTTFWNYRSYQSNGLTYDGSTVIKENKVLKDGEVLRSLDKDAQAFTGKIDKNKINTLYKEYEVLMKKTYENDVLDVEKMEKRFGKDYQEYKNKVENKQLSEEEYFSKYCGENCEVYQDETGEYVFPIYYKNDGIRRYYNTLYWDMSWNNPTTVSKEQIYNVNAPLTQLIDKEALLYSEGEKVTSLYYLDGKKITELERVLETYFSDKIEKQDLTYTSTLANNLFLSNTRKSFSFFILLLIAIVVANIFSNETHYKTDQIIVPTKLGNTRLTIAKCICGLSIAIGIILIQWILLFVVATMFVPLHDLQGLIISQLGQFIEIVNFAFTYQEIIMWGIAITILGGLLVASVTMALSYFTRNRFWAIIPSILFIFVPLMIPIFTVLFNTSWMDFVMPARAMMFTSLFQSGDQYSGYPYLLLGGSVIPVTYIVVGSYAIISCLLCAIMIAHSKKHIVNNR